MLESPDTRLMSASWWSWVAAARERARRSSSGRQGNMVSGSGSKAAGLYTGQTDSHSLASTSTLLPAGKILHTERMGYNYMHF